MARKMTRTSWTVVASLALAAGSAAAEPTSNGPGMEIVEVVEKFEPAPISTHDYFREVAKIVDPLEKELERMLSASVNTTFGSLSEKLEAKRETRLAATDVMDRRLTVASAATSDTPERASM